MILLAICKLAVTLESYDKVFTRIIYSKTRSRSANSITFYRYYFKKTHHMVSVDLLQKEEKITFPGMLMLGTVSFSD